MSSQVHPSREFPPTNTMQVATDAQVTQYLADARAFIESTGYYQSIRSTAACAVAEYMASLDGLTIRTSQE